MQIVIAASFPAVSKLTRESDGFELVPPKYRDKVTYFKHLPVGQKFWTYRYGYHGKENKPLLFIKSDNKHAQRAEQVKKYGSDNAHSTLFSQRDVVIPVNSRST